MEGRSVVPMGVRMVVQKEAPMEGRSVAPMVVQKEVPRVGRTGECLEGSGRMAEPVEVLLRLQVGVVEVTRRFPLRVQVGPRRCYRSLGLGRCQNLRPGGCRRGRKRCEQGVSGRGCLGCRRSGLVWRRCWGKKKIARGGDGGLGGLG